MFQFMRSVGSFFWSMSMLGLQQFSLVLRPGEGVQSAAQGFRTMTHTASGQLQGPFRQIHRAGEEMQDGMMETMEGFMSPQALRPGRALTLTCGFWQRSMRAMGEILSGPRNTGGWGQMPPT